MEGDLFLDSEIRAHSLLEGYAKKAGHNVSLENTTLEVADSNRGEMRLEIDEILSDGHLISQQPPVLQIM